MENNKKNAAQSTQELIVFLRGHQMHILVVSNLPKKTLSSSSIVCWLLASVASVAIALMSSTNADGGNACIATLNADPFKISPDNIQNVVGMQTLVLSSYLKWKKKWG